MSLPDFTQFYTTKLYNTDGISSTQTTAIELEDISKVDDITRPGVLCFGYRDPLITSTSEWIFYTSITPTTGTRGTLNGVTRAFDNSIQALSFKKGTVVAFIVSKYHMKTMRDQIENSLPYSLTSVYRQALINAGGDDPSNTVAQSGRFVGACNTWSNHTNFYGVDGWLIYGSDTTQMASDGDVGGIRAYRWNTSTATNKVAIMQILEANNSYQLRNNVLSFGFVPSFLGGVNDKEDLTVFVLAMKASGTANSVTNPPITSFGASGTRPTFDSTNYTVLYQADVSKSLIDGVYRVTGTTITVPSDAKNIIFGVVNKDGFYNGGDVYAGFKINRCQLNIGASTLPFTAKSFSEELSLCQRLYEKLDYGTNFPSDAQTAASRHINMSTSTVGLPVPISFKVTKRTTPKLSGVIRYDINDGTAATGDAINATLNGFMFLTNVSPGQFLDIHDWVADARL